MASVSLTWPEYLAGCCRIDGRLTRLSFQEADMLLALLLGHPARWTTRAMLIDRMWPDPDKQPEAASSHLTVLISKLRRRGVRIENEYGFGYRIPRSARGRA